MADSTVHRHHMSYEPVQVSTGAGGGLNILDWTKKSHQFFGNLIISLD